MHLFLGHCCLVFGPLLYSNSRCTKQAADDWHQLHKPVRNDAGDLDSALPRKYICTLDLRRVITITTTISAGLRRHDRFPKLSRTLSRSWAHCALSFSLLADWLTDLTAFSWLPFGTRRSHAKPLLHKLPVHQWTDYNNWTLLTFKVSLHVDVFVNHFNMLLRW